MNKWKRLRVVVELPVQGNYSEKDLRWDVANMISEGKLRRAAGPDVQHGRLQVKEFSRVARQVQK